MTFFSLLFQQRNELKTYYKTARTDIAATNLALLRFVSAVAIITVALLIIITPFFMKNWDAAVEHWAIFASMLFFHLFSIFYSKYGTQNPVVITVSCIIFFVTVLIHLSFIGTFPYPSKSDIFVSFAFILLPVLFIIPMQVSATILFVFELFYCVLVIKAKPYDIAIEDIFRSIAALFFSAILTPTVSLLRARDNINRLRFEHLSKTDKLTGILNKISFEETCKEYLSTKSPSENCTLFIIDMDNFKAVNDTLGHRAGDELLEGFGEALRSIFRATDIIGRIGGDEFSVLMKSIVDTDLIMKKTEIIEARSAKILHNDAMNISCSIGAVMGLGASINFESLLNQADQALYEAKAQGKARCNIAF